MGKDEKTGIEIRTENDIVVIVFEAASITDVEQITAASEQAAKFIEENQPKRIIVDFGQVKFFSSQVLGMLLAIRSKLKDYDGQVVISSINPQLYRVFKITSLDKIFKFFPDKKSAVEQLSSN